MAKSEGQAPMLSLQSIYLRGGTIEMSEDFHPNLPGIRMVPLLRTADCKYSCNTTQIQAEDVPEQTLHWCQFISRFQFVYVLPKEDGSQHAEDEIDTHRLASITAEITAVYNLSGDTLPDAETLHHWASNNVVLHTWPYWREYCHNTLLRMGLPVTMIPLVSLAPPQGQDTSAE